MAVMPAVSQTRAAIDLTFVEVERAVHLMFVLGQHAVADHVARLEVATAEEVVGIVRAAAAAIEGGLRIRAQRPRARDASDRVLCEDGLGRIVVLDPRHERAEQVLRLRPRTATAMTDTRRAEQAVEILQPLEVRLVMAPVARGHLAVIVDHALRHDELVVGAYERQQLAAAALERVEIAERIS